MDKANIEAAAGQQLRTTIALAVLFNEWVASEVGMTLSEMQTIHLLQLQGSLSPGEITAATGLTSGSTTALLDRLAQLKFIRRAPHPTDRRKVLISLNEAQVFKKLMPYYQSKAEHAATVISTFTAAELAIINRFFIALNEEERVS
ncbi:MAG TPA: MarR family transcriptional regulator [Candidatus Saccharimonadales bacterium]|nr:MarR family transcriptional regulator [Candidatus Saccharimonadales bacterium]